MMDDSPKRTRLSVLLVDDIQENLTLLEDVLFDQGYATISRRSGIEALAYLESETVHLIVADAMMPSIDGFQLCKEVRGKSQFADTPFIIYTGNYVDREDEKFARSIGVDRYVMKYNGLAPLVDAVNELSRQRYGFQTERNVEKHVAGSPLQEVDEQKFLEQHHAIIVKKLEEKMRELEMYAETLSKKNKELLASEVRYRNLFEQASVGIFMLERNTGKVLDVNAKGQSILGYSRDEILAMPDLKSLQGDGQPSSGAETDTRGVREGILKRKDGTMAEVEMSSGPISQSKDSQMLLYVLDITEQKKMRRQLLEAEKMSLMGRLAAGIAHDIRNPLAAVSLNLQYISKRIGADFPGRAALDYALEGAQRIGKVVDNTLSLARVSPPLVSPENVNDLVQRAIGFINTSLQEKELSVEEQLASNLPRIPIEAKQIEQVMLNLLQNAIDASEPGGSISVSTCLMEDNDPQEVAFVVLDRGTGIPPESVKNLFEPFHTTKTGGTGLGLALAKQIMDKHNGSIRVEPALGGGTVARLQFKIEHSNLVSHE